MKARSNAKRGRVATTKTLSAPVGGLNALNALAEMPETDAVIMDNWFPRTSDIVTRNGFASWATGFTGNVETLLAFRSSTTQQMFGIANGSVYNCTSFGAIGAAVVTGLQNSRFQYTNFGTIGGHFVYAVNDNPIDPPLLYDGATWLNIGNGTGVAISTITFVGTLATVTTTTPHGLVNGATVTITVAGAVPAAYNVTAVPINVTGASTFTYTMATTPATNATTVGSFTYTPSVQGVDPRLFKNCDAINSRMWFVERGSLRAWYLPLNSISGTANVFDLSSLSKMGGALAGVFGWSVASVYGMTNYTVFITTEGEVFVYQGYDPSNAATFALSTRGRIGAPVGERFWTRIGTDVGILGRDGIVPLTKALQVDRNADNVAISYKIVNLINNDVANNKALFGWQMMIYPLGSLLVVNVPQFPAGQFIQYVMNTITSSWCRYVGLNASCFEYLNDTLFFGGNGAVYQAETGNTDNGAPIQSVAKQAFSFFDDPGSEKRFTGTRPIITTFGGGSVALDVNVDFEDRPATSIPILVVASGQLNWPFAWPSTWGPAAAVSKTLQYVSGIGYAAAVKLQAVTRGSPISWQATTYIYERGGPI